MIIININNNVSLSASERCVRIGTVCTNFSNRATDWREIAPAVNLLPLS